MIPAELYARRLAHLEMLGYTPTWAVVTLEIIMKEEAGSVVNSKPVTADTKQEGGQHYKKCPPEFQHWNLVTVHGWDYFQAQAIKYIMRYKDKNGVEDLKKAAHYLDKMVEVELAAIARRGPPAIEVLPPELEGLPSTYKVYGKDIDPKNYPADLKEILERVKPTGWIGFVFEGATKETFLYTCSYCRAKVETKEFTPPHLTHNNYINGCRGGEPGHGYVCQ